MDWEYENEEEEIYEIDVECKNCEDEMELEIPTGTTVDKYLKTHECKNCGCVNGETTTKTKKEKEEEDEDDENESYI